MFDPKKLQQIADDLGEPRKQIVNEALELLNFYMGRTGEMFAEIERLKKQVNDKTQKLAQVIGERDDALNERDEYAASAGRLRNYVRHQAFCNCAFAKELLRTTSATQLIKHDGELLGRFSDYLKERCDLHVQNMVRPFLDKE